MTSLQDVFTSWDVKLRAKTFCLIWGPVLGELSSGSSGKALSPFAPQ